MNELLSQAGRQGQTLTCPEPLELSREYLVCPLCTCQQTEKVFRDNGCELRVCENCDLFFTSPYPLPTQQHSEVASGSSGSITLLDCRRRYEGEREYYSRHFAAIEAECRGVESVLDVGCGTGRLLELLRNHSCHSRLGIELNAEAAAFARRMAGCEIVELPFERFACERPFDAILLINVFSHFPSFDELFAALDRTLASGGKIVIRTSEMARGVNRWNQLHWGLPDDLHFLGMRTLDFLCARYGFTIKKHVRTPFEDELFRVSRWRQMGRSHWLNAVKRVAVQAPGVLSALRVPYRALLGNRFFVSFIVLERQPAGASALAQRRMS